MAKRTPRARWNRTQQQILLLAPDLVFSHASFANAYLPRTTRSVYRPLYSIRHPTPIGTALPVLMPLDPPWLSIIGLARGSVEGKDEIREWGSPFKSFNGQGRGRHGHGIVAKPPSPIVSSGREPGTRLHGRLTPDSIGGPIPRRVITADFTEFFLPCTIGLQAVNRFSASVVGFCDALVGIPLRAICYNLGPDFGTSLVSSVADFMLYSKFVIV